MDKEANILRSVENSSRRSLKEVVCLNPSKASFNRFSILQIQNAEIDFIDDYVDDEDNVEMVNLYVDLLIQKIKSNYNQGC